MITVTVTTRNRYLTTLPLCLFSISQQTLIPKKVILVDDNDRKEFYNYDILKNILNLFKLKGIEFEYFHGECKGQVYAQQIAYNHTNTDWIFKIDDDNVLEPNVLEILSNNIKENVGCLSGLILSKKDMIRKIEYVSHDTYNKIQDIYRYFNIQMCPLQDNKIKKVEHVYSNYLFKKDIIKSYPLDFAPAGHREDTVTTYEIFRKGYNILIVPEAKIWNMNEQSGGNKRFDYNESVKNEKLFMEKLKEWGINLTFREDKYGLYNVVGGKDWLVYEKR